MTSGRACVVAILAYGCAKGGAAMDDAGGPADSAAHHDAHPQTVIPDASKLVDGAVAIDASVMVDAASLGLDASTDGNICTDNNQCTDSGECCLSIGGIGICQPGVIVSGTCL